MKRKLYFLLMSFIGLLTILAGELEPVAPTTVKPGQTIVWTAEETTLFNEVELIITNTLYHDC